MNRYGNLKSIKEIADETGRSRTYVQAVKSAMKQQRIIWVMGMISTKDFLKWVARNNFKCTDFVRSKKN
jgi:hypothetical protein